MSTTGSLRRVLRVVWACKSPTRLLWATFAGARWAACTIMLQNTVQFTSKCDHRTLRSHPCAWHGTCFHQTKTIIHVCARSSLKPISTDFQSFQLHLSMRSRSLIGISSPFWSTLVFDRWPTHVNIRVLRKAFPAMELQAYLRVVAQSRRGQDREHIHLCFLVSLHFSIGCYHHFRGSGSPQNLISSELKSSFCSACALIEAPESTTNSRSSGDSEVGAGIALASIGE